jgi:hypothetical protein
LQAKPHAPLLQVAIALAGAGQALPHMPQLLTSVLVLTHAPPHWV